MSLYFIIKEACRKLGVIDEHKYIPQFRLEGRARDPDNEDNLAMRTADPLWMLGRQWQFGEFIGEDNGSPIQISTNYHKRKASYYKVYKVPDSKPIPLESESNEEVYLPLEVNIEAMTVIPDDLRSRVRIGQQFKRILQRRFMIDEVRTFTQQLLQQYPLQTPAHSDDETMRFIRSTGSRAIDGAKLLQDIQDELLHNRGFSDLVPAGNELKAWFSHLYYQPHAEHTDAWNSKLLSHQFTLSAPGDSDADVVDLNVPDYQSGELDWYTFDNFKSSNTRQLANDIENKTQESDSYFPVNLSFPAMPNRRLFSFEDNMIDLGNMDVDDADMIRIMLIDFALISGDDWYTIPLEMTLGEMCWIREIKVKDVFGVETLVKNGIDLPNGRKSGPSLSYDKDADNKLTGLDMWDVFKIRDQLITAYNPKDHFLFLPPTVATRQESAPLEEVLFIRDEGANMVWGIERQLQNGLGKPVNGFDLHREVNGPFDPLESGDRNDFDHEIYRLATPVPTNWVPYIPRMEGTNLVLHRANLPSNEPDELFRQIHQLSHLTKHDLLAVYEEAIPRAGVRVRLTRQRIRWSDGKTYLWQGRTVLAGRGEGNSGLKFDQIN